MSGTAEPIDPKVHDIYAAMKEVQLFADDPETEGTSIKEPDWRLLLETVEEAHGESYANLNQKRKLLTFKAFKDPQIVSKTLVLDALIKPNLRAMHVLFKRTNYISEMQKPPLSRADELAKCREEILALASFYFVDEMDDLFIINQSLNLNH